MMRPQEFSPASHRRIDDIERTAGELNGRHQFLQRLTASHWSYADRARGIVLATRGISPGAKLLFAALQYFADFKTGGNCSPSQERLGDILGASVPTVQRWEKELRDAGLMKTIQRKRQEAVRSLLCPKDVASILAEITNQDPSDLRGLSDQDPSDSMGLTADEVQDPSDLMGETHQIRWPTSSNYLSENPIDIDLEEESRVFETAQAVSAEVVDVAYAPVGAVMPFPSPAREAVFLLKEEEVGTAVALFRAETSTSISLAATSGPAFEEFWSEYPNKSGKARARALWSRMSVSSRQAAIAALPAYKESRKVQEGFVQQGDTFLSKRTWEDAPFDSGGVARIGADKKQVDRARQSHPAGPSEWAEEAIARGADRRIADKLGRMLITMSGEKGKEVDYLIELSLAVRECGDVSDEVLEWARKDIRLKCQWRPAFGIVAREIDKQNRGARAGDWTDPQLAREKVYL